MSDASVSLVQDMYAAFGRGEIATIVSRCAPDIRWEINGRRSDFPTFGAFHGHSGVQEFFGTVAAHLDFSEFTPQEFYPSGEKVFVLGRYKTAVKKTGREIASNWCHVFTIRSGTVISFQEFTDTAQARDAHQR
jgi:ketosteroid isomerase-like protein